MTDETDSQECRPEAPGITPEVSLEPMDVGFGPDVIEDLRERLRRTRHPAPLDDDWAKGVPASWLSDLLADWQAYDIGAFKQRLAGLTHLRARVEDQLVHVLVAAGRGPDPLPLLLANGWPSSFCEYLDVLPLLTDPGGHGGDPADAFTVVAPALPGFGFSAPPPPAGISPVRVARMWHRLMTHGLEHPRYVAHGSDLGAGVVAHLARAHPASVAGIHLATPGLPLPAQCAAARNPDPLLGHRDDHLVDAPVLELSPHRGSGPAAGGPVTGAHRGEHLRRRADPVPAAAP